MIASSSLKSNFTYLTYLTKAVLEGISTAPKKEAGGKFTPVSAAAVWMPAAIGAAIGILGGSLKRRNGLGYRVTLGGLVGSVVGLSAGVGWTSRDFTGAVARSTIRNVNRVRDARWLEKNPINYA